MQLQKSSVLSLILICLMLTLNIDLQSAAGNIEKADPEEIKLFATIGDSNIDQLTQNEIIFSSSNITGAKVITRDLIDEKEGRSINASEITVTPITFNITTTEGGFGNLKVVVDAGQAKSGVYSGRIYIINPPNSPFVIPITVTIRDPVVYGLGLVALGVALNFTIKILAPKTEEEKDKEGKPLLRNGRQAYKIVFFPLKSNVAERGGVSYIVISILVGIAVLTVWQSFYPNLATFGRSWIDYIGAILVGFGSQAVISEAVDITRKALAK